MKRAKKHKVKDEIPETSTSKSKDNKEHDLAYYIHDRVELMHQVFSVIKPKELKSLTPDCVRHISLDDLQELCTEELLGISSKRLCAILDGAEPPSDTESSSSSLELETISLDSISSDDEILSQSSSRGRKHKHKRKKSKGKHRRREASPGGCAGRAGLTVLELLELQARARAIRAQLQQHRVKSPENPETVKVNASDDEVEIKEEPAEVVEISSDEEKPNVKQLEEKLAKETTAEDNKVTKRINDLVITVPQSKQSRKIKLNRPKTVPTDISKPKDNVNPQQEITKDKEVKNKRKQKKKLKNKEKDRDHDEITLQLSDTEKMDLLEDFDRKDYDNVTTSEDLESSSDTDKDSTDKEVEATNEKTAKSSKENSRKKGKTFNAEEHSEKNDTKKLSTSTTSSPVSQKNNSNIKIVHKSSINTEPSKTENSVNDKLDLVKISGKISSINNNDNTNNETQQDESNNGIKNSSVNVSDKSDCNKDSCDAIIIAEMSTKTKEISDSSNAPKLNLSMVDPHTQESLSGQVVNKVNLKLSESTEAATQENITTSARNSLVMETDEDNIKSQTFLSDDLTSQKNYIITEKVKMNTDDALNNASNDRNDTKEKTYNANDECYSKSKEDDVEEGEINDTLSDGEIFETEPSDVVCISDEEVKKKKKKKEKKAKKEKLDFHKGADQNFFEESCADDKGSNRDPEIIIIDDEIYELSDDSYCVEVEGTVLSEEPTTEEIVALSAKIDDTINKEDSDEQKEIEMSWKDRYLDSNKVKKVLTTSNILNALRKKNKELKTKLEERKLRNCEELNKVEEKDPVEGSIDHFNALEGSTKYVDPITIEKPKDTNDLSKEMEKDAKQLLRMYKKLLKYNDMNRQKDPNKKKKKKAKKKKDKDKNKEV